MKAVAFVPARSGSVRVPDKNVRVLGEHPLIAYTISAALDSGVFDEVVVSTDSETYADIARHYGATVPGLRPQDIASSTSPDIEWVVLTLEQLAEQGREYDCFSILRPTSPFRQADTIRRAFAAFTSHQGLDSLRAVEVCKQHPGKMWVVRGETMTPLMPLSPEEQPWHSTQFAALPTVYVQNASLEIAWVRCALEQKTIAGNVIAPFFTSDMEGFDINDPRDWTEAEHLVAENPAALPNVNKSPYTS
ncbi:MAG: acylneuraminate cytidylyltransferase family protein [Pseudomonadota bacterium]